MERTLIGLSQLLKVVEKLWLVGHKFANLGTEFSTYQSFATDLSNCDRPIRVLSTTLSNPIRELFRALQLWSPISASCWTLEWKIVTVKQDSYTREGLFAFSCKIEAAEVTLFGQYFSCTPSQRGCGSRLTICQLNQFHTNSEAVMLSNPSHLWKQTWIVGALLSFENRNLALLATYPLHCILPLEPFPGFANVLNHFSPVPLKFLAEESQCQEQYWCKVCGALHLRHFNFFSSSLQYMRQNQIILRYNILCISR